MLNEYIRAALRTAKYEILSDDGSYYAEMPGFQGVYANASTVEDCRNELKSVLEEWLLFKLSEGDSVPTVNDVDFSFGRKK